jgi:hypothetical protein
MRAAACDPVRHDALMEGRGDAGALLAAEVMVWRGPGRAAQRSCGQASGGRAREADHKKADAQDAWTSAREPAEEF